MKQHQQTARSDDRSDVRSDEVCRLRALVATYRAPLHAYTLAVSPVELMQWCGGSGGAAPQPGARDDRAQAHLDRLRDAVHAHGIALPNAIVVAVSGGRMQCESDHLYTLELHARTGDHLIVLDGHDRLAQMASGERGTFKTLVTAVLCRTAIDLDAQGQSRAEADTGVIHASAAARWASAVRVWQ